MKKFLLTLTTLLVLSASVFAGKPDKATQKFIDQSVESTKALLPLQLDEYTYFIDFASEDDCVIYYYELTITADDIDTELFIDQMTTILTETVKDSTDPTISYLKKKKISFRHIYYDSNDEVLADITITPKMYK